MGNEITTVLSMAMVLTAVTTWVWIIARARQWRIQFSARQDDVIKQNEAQHAAMQQRMDEALKSINNIERLLMDAD